MGGLGHASIAIPHGTVAMYEALHEHRCLEAASGNLALFSCSLRSFHRDRTTDQRSARVLQGKPGKDIFRPEATMLPTGNGAFKLGVHCCWLGFHLWLGPGAAGPGSNDAAVHYQAYAQWENDKRKESEQRSGSQRAFAPTWRSEEGHYMRTCLSIVKLQYMH
ncbi:hypothetical protein GQ54DRAFT_299121 [Martensiomyces pterosporus]|nr:hypothetical protein GQ54DRAFT_299121 [Martensiomyces pterosporus]